MVPIGAKEGLIWDDDTLSIKIKIDLIKFFGRILVEFIPKGGSDLSGIQVNLGELGDSF